MKNSFDSQVQGFAVQLVGALSALAPVIIVLSMLACFFWLGVMDYRYFETALPSSGLAIVAAVFLQSMRFGTALGSVRLFRAGKITGILFLGASLLLTWLESGHVVKMADTLSDAPGAMEANRYLITLAVWASVGLELLVAVLFSAMYDEYRGEHTDKHTDTHTDSGAGAYGFSGNGEHTDKHTDNGRACENCGTDISHLRADAKYCSDDCRVQSWEKSNGRTPFFKKGK